MATRNLEEIYTEQDPFLHDDVAVDDLLYWWDGSAAGAARSRAMDRHNLQLLANRGVDVQRGGTKPTTRSNGDALVGGDRWWDTTDLQWWFWNGTYWLSETVSTFESRLSADISASTNQGGIPVNPAGNDLFLLDLRASIHVAAGSFDGSNYWVFSTQRTDPSNATNGVGTAITINSTPATVRSFWTSTYNLHRDVSALGDVAYFLRWLKTGSPPNILSTSVLECRYRFAKP